MPKCSEPVWKEICSLGLTAKRFQKGVSMRWPMYMRFSGSRSPFTFFLCAASVAMFALVPASDNAENRTCPWRITHLGKMRTGLDVSVAHITELLLYLGRILICSYFRTDLSVSNKKG